MTKNHSIRLCWLLALSVYSKELFDIKVGSSDVDTFQIVVAGYGAVFYGLSSHFAQRVALAWAAILSSSFVLLTYFNHDTNILIRQGIPVAITYFGFAGILSRVDPNELAAIYKRVSFWVAGFGLIQFVLSIAGVMLLIKTRGRLDSIVYEPSHYAIAMAPAAYMSIKHLLTNSASSSLKTHVANGVILCSFAATFSLTALAILLFCIILVSASSRVLSLFLVLTAICTFAFLDSSALPEAISARIEGLRAVTEGETKAFRVTNLTVYSALTNLEVATDSITQGRLLGNGFGGHPSAYSDYIRRKGYILNDREGMNAISAHSLFIRVLSEFGIIGIGLYVLWLRRGIFSRNNPFELWWTLSAVYFFGRIFKLGGYFEVGMPVFLLAPLVFYTWRPHRSANSPLQPRWNDILRSTRDQRNIQVDTN